MTTPGILVANDDTVRGHCANAYQLLLCHASAENETERRVALDGVRRRLRMALELLDAEARATAQALAFRKAL